LGSLYWNSQNFATKLCKNHLFTPETKTLKKSRTKLLWQKVTSGDHPYYSVIAKTLQNSNVTQFEVYGPMILDDTQDKKSLLRKILRETGKELNISYLTNWKHSNRLKLIIDYEGT